MDRFWFLKSSSRGYVTQSQEFLKFWEDVPSCRPGQEYRENYKASETYWYQTRHWTNIDPIWFDGNDKWPSIFTSLENMMFLALCCCLFFYSFSVSAAIISIVEYSVSILTVPDYPQWIWYRFHIIGSIRHSIIIDVNKLAM